MDENEEDHVIQLVGRTGVKKAYLDVSKEEALRRFHQDKSTDHSLPLDCVDSVYFDDEFLALNVWPSNKDEDCKDEDNSEE
jgi:hypothetical protein